MPSVCIAFLRGGESKLAVSKGVGWHAVGITARQSGHTEGAFPNYESLSYASS